MASEISRLFPIYGDGHHLGSYATAPAWRDHSADQPNAGSWHSLITASVKKSEDKPRTALEIAEIIMRAAVSSFFSRLFQASSSEAIILKQTLLLWGAVLFVWLLMTTYGLDLKSGFF